MTLKKQIARSRTALLGILSGGRKRAAPPKKAVVPKRPSPASPSPASNSFRPTGLDLALNRARMAYATAILHVSDGIGAEFHLDLWIHDLRRALGPDVIIVVRSRPLFEKVSKRSDMDCIYIRDSRDAERLVYQCPELKAVFYVSNTGNVIHFVRLNHLRHVFLGHGDSDKTASCHRFFRVYDEVWTAGQAHIDRFATVGFRTDSIDFKIIGRPGMRGALEAPAATHHERFLYLPTWEGYQDSQNYSSLPIAVDILLAAQSATQLRPRVKFHPFTGSQKSDAVYKEATLKRAFEGRLDVAAEVSPDEAPRPPVMEVYPRPMSVSDCVPDAAFLISDISSVISDFLVTLRPIFLFLPSAIDVKMAQSQIPYESYAYQFSTPEQLRDLIERVIVRGEDSLADGRREALAYFVDVQATLEDRFVHEARRLCSPEAS